MSLQDIRSECSDTAALLQPYVDAELGGEDEQRVATHLEGCVPCRAAVQEQIWVRATLRALERPVAPQALRARLLLSLDEVDREQAVVGAAAEDPKPSSFWKRARALWRGSLAMLPAGVVAMALFVTVRSGLTPVSDVSTAGLGASLAATSESKSLSESLANLEPQVGFPVQVARDDSASDVELVSAQLDETRTTAPAVSAAASLRYRVLREGDRIPRHVLDRQAPASGSSFEGRPVTFRGHRYLLHRGEGGRPVVQFERSGIAHTLVLETADARPPGAPEDVSEPDFSLLLQFADSHLRRDEE